MSHANHSNDRNRRRRESADADAFRKTRRDHAGETAEDYVELILHLIRESGEARAVDIAERLGVSHVTVTRTVARLQRDGWVTSAPYRPIHLTEKGKQLAARSEERHAMVVAFLRKLGVNEADAVRDAEGVEHHLSDATLQAMRAFMENRD